MVLTLKRMVYTRVCMWGVGGWMEAIIQPTISTYLASKLYFKDEAKFSSCRSGWLWDWKKFAGEIYPWYGVLWKYQNRKQSPDSLSGHSICCMVCGEHCPQTSVSLSPLINQVFWEFLHQSFLNSGRTCIKSLHVDSRISTLAWKCGLRHDRMVLKSQGRQWPPWWKSPPQENSSFNGICACVLSSFRHVRLFVALWTVACQAPLSMGFSRQGYWSGLPYPPPGDLLNPGIKSTALMSPALAGCFFITSTTWEAQWHLQNIEKKL